MWMAQQLDVDNIVATNHIEYISNYYHSVSCNDMHLYHARQCRYWESEAVLQRSAVNAYRCGLLRMFVRELLANSANAPHIPPIQASLAYAVRCHSYMFGYNPTYVRSDGVIRGLDDIAKDMLFEIQTLGAVPPVRL